MNFAEWIEQIGPKKLSEILGVTPMTIGQWKRGDTSPQVMTAHKIIQISYGVMTWKSIYAIYVAKRIGKDPSQTEMNLGE